MRIDFDSGHCKNARWKNGIIPDLASNSAQMKWEKEIENFNIERTK